MNATGDEMWELFLQRYAVLEIPIKLFGCNESYSAVYDLETHQKT